MRISPEELAHYARSYRQLVASRQRPEGTFEHWLHNQMHAKQQGTPSLAQHGVTTAETLLLHTLSQHIGAQHRISHSQLVQHTFGAPDNLVRARQLHTLVKRLRARGYHICGSVSRGYYLPANPDELDRACLELQRRAVDTLQQVRAMRAQPLRTAPGSHSL